MSGYTAPKYGQSRRLYTSQAKETTWGTAQTLVFSWDTPGDAPALRHTPEMIPNSQWASGLTTEFPTKLLPIQYSMDGTVNLWPSPEAVALFGSFALGAGDTESGTGVTGYKHAFAMAAIGAEVPGMTVEEHLGGDTVDATTDFIHTGVAVDKLELSGGTNGWGRLAASLFGRGQAAAGSTQSGLLSPTGWMTAQKLRVGIAPCATEGTTVYTGTPTAPTAEGAFVNLTGTSGILGAGLINVSPMLDSWKLTYDNGLTAQRKGGVSSSAGSYVGPIQYGPGRSITFEMTLALCAETKALIAACAGSTYANNIQYAVAVEGVAAGIIGSQPFYAGFCWTLPLCTVPTPSVPAGGVDGPQKETITFKAMQPTAGSYTTSPSHLVVYTDSATEYCE